MRELERVVLLRVVDEYWMDHIDAMQELRQGIRLRAYAQVNPIDAYKKESLEMFEEMISAIQDETVRRIFSARIKSEAEVKRERVAEGIVATTAGDGSVKKQPRKVQKIGRNDPCPCGSGKSISSAADGNGRSLLIRSIRAAAAPSGERAAIRHFLRCTAARKISSAADGKNKGGILFPKENTPFRHEGAPVGSSPPPAGRSAGGRHANKFASVRHTGGAEYGRVKNLHWAERSVDEHTAL